MNGQCLLRRLPLLLLLLFVCACGHQPANGRRWVRDIDIEGARNIDLGELEEGLSTQETGWFFFGDREWLDLVELDVDLRRIQQYYADHGYFDMRIVSHKVEPDRDGSVNVRIVVEEGRATHVGKLDVRGLESIDPKQATKLMDRLPIKEGDIFVYDEFDLSKRRIDRRLRQNGYAYTKVDGKAYVDRDAGAATLRIDTKPGPLVHYGKIDILGSGDIPVDKVRQRFTFEEGEQYDPDDLETTQGRLYNLGVFSSVRIDLAQEPQQNPPLKVYVSPGQLRELRLGGGVGVERLRQEVRARADWTINNFLGGLRTLRLRLKPAYVVIPDAFDVRQSGIAADNDLTLRQPDVFGTRATMQALIGYDLGIYEGYQYHGPRAQLGFERPFLSEHVLGGVSWNLQYLSFFNVDATVFNPLTTPLGFGFKDPYRLAYLEQFLTIELRDRPLSARSGAYATMRAEEGTAAVGGDFTYLKLTPEVRGYIPLGRRITMALRAQVGWLSPNGRIDSPITRRYALGGPSTHRGFGFGRLAPQIVSPTGRRVPVGGDGAVLFSVETRFNVARLAGNWFGFVPFVDAGDVTPTFSQLSLRELHYATGFQLDYETPIGVIRAGIGFRLNRTGIAGPNNLDNPDPGELFSFFFSIGEAF